MPPSSAAELLPSDLRNRSFQELDCEGLDLSGRDIRGCNFRGTKLKDANFSQVTTGRSRRQDLVTVAGSITGAVAGSVTGVGIVTGVVADIVAGAGADIFAVVGVATGTNAFAVSVIGAFIGTGAVAGAVAAIVMLTVVFAVAFSGSSAKAGGVEAITDASTVAFAVSGSISGAFAVFKAIEAFNKGQTPAAVFWSILAVLLIVIAFQFAREALRALRTSTGTDFNGADLQGVDFSHATLNNCNFDYANIRFVNWSHVKGDRSTINFTSTRMHLLISRSGTNAMYVERDLSDCHLAGIDLVKANLQGADLTRSNLQHADLTFANLTNAKAGGTDFRHATLTGSCIQNWTINSDTQFDDLICDYIYLTPDRNDQSRRPSSGSFEPGDFEKLLDHFADTLDFILRRGTDPIAFSQALNQLKKDNPEAELKAVIQLDHDQEILHQITLPEGVDKVEPSKKFSDTVAQLRAAREEVQYLKGKTDSHKENQEFTMQILGSYKLPDVKLIQANEMTDKSTRTQVGGDMISADNNAGVVGKDMTGVAGRDISGTLNLNLAALKKTEDPKAKELVELISQLRQAIEAPDCDLEDRFTQRALEYLDNLTKLAKDQPDDRLKQAKDNLDDLTDIAEKGSKLANFAEEYFPAVTAAIAGIRLWFGV
jgi:uncharacterized protein YjbI with pentapeptide repeats